MSNKVDALNAREQLEAAATWLGCQHEDLSYGLKGPEDGLKLWRYWSNHPELPEFCDHAEDDRDKAAIVRHLVSALSYDPFRREIAAAHTTG